MTSSGLISANKLSAADLRTNPIWRFRTDAEGGEEVDESHVAPHNEPLALGTFGSYLVAATYRLKNGATLPGAVQVDVLGEKAYFTPAVVYARERSVDPLDRDAERRLSRITKMSDAKPMRWELAVTFHDESQTRRGRIARSTYGIALLLLARLVFLRFSR
ncbi:hypothetical protein [Pseudomonas sp. SO81]|uniref:hypothetical protein n=1 Tax=Pseudomonas sp. SO81 TaxID=2983246 RepID=UPI0025A43B70|nr:hypothetical protein [Pseudomonas sp. SO81]WJN61118.1 hypothetical protein OH686_20425 [Pseudomonas sp. SO81]